MTKLNTPQNKKNVPEIADSGTEYPFSRKNFIGMLIAGAMIVIGFLLILGGSSTPDSFNPDIFSTRRIVVGPLIAFLGFVGMAVAIIIKPSKK